MKNAKKIGVFVRQSSFTAVFIVLSLLTVQAATQIDIPGPTGSGFFGQGIKVLPNGNIVITDTVYDTTVADVGAVHLYDGRTGALISTLTGSRLYDNVGSGGVTVLTNGDYVVSSPNWDNGTVRDVGAVTICSGTTGCSGVVSPANSLVGSIQGDQVGAGGVIALPNGNYLISSFTWNNTLGAVTWRSPAMKTSGELSAANSLIGSNYGDYLGIVKVLSNGNYIVSDPRWNGNRGAVKLCNGATGCSGTISSANSLVGTNTYDSVSSGGITELTNGNFVVDSPSWVNGTFKNAGAVTFGNGTTGVVGEVSSSNSLVGIAASDNIGGGGITALTNGNYVVLSPKAATFGNGEMGITGTISASNSLIGSAGDDFYLSSVKALTNGNYVVITPRWSPPSIPNAGAVTFGDGKVGVKGLISSSKSLIGDGINESVGGDGVTPLTNGNYVVVTTFWNSSRGAVTFGDGATGITGTLGASNSLVGTDAGERIGYDGICALTNGNYVVNSSFWGSNQRGAATFCNGTNGCGGTVSPANSLVGTTALDRVGGGGTLALTNGNYVVSSNSWSNNLGAVTFGNGTTGVVGEVSSSNSLIGDQNGSVGGVTILPGGSYLISSPNWNNSRGALTWASGAIGITGTISSANSLVGSQPNDYVASGGVKILLNGNYVVLSPAWHNGSIANAGAVTLGNENSPLIGEITSQNSVLGTFAFPYADASRFVFAYDNVNRQLVVGRLVPNIVTLFRNKNVQTLFDFDGDGRADISVFRPSNGAWYLLNSTSGFTAAQFGVSTDKIVPADYDGDGKADIAVYRDGTWYLQRSSLGFTGISFGQAGDIPVPADFDGDGKAEIAVFRPSNGTWYIYNLVTNQSNAVQFGQSGDIPVVADYDGDGKADVAVYRPSQGTWYIQRSRDGFTGIGFGISADKPVPADYDGDGKADIAVFRPDNGTWYLLQSTAGFTGVQFGLGTDKPAPADYDGDGKADIAVFRDGTWYLQRSRDGFTGIGFGVATDKAVPNAFVP